MEAYLLTFLLFYLQYQLKKTTISVELPSAFDCYKISKLAWTLVFSSN